MDSLTKQSIKGSPEKATQPEKISHPDCCPPDSTCGERMTDMSQLVVDYTTIFTRFEAKLDFLMSQTEALQAKSEEMQAKNNEVQAKLLRKNEELSTKLDDITPEKLKCLVNKSIAEASILLEMRSEIKFLFEWRKKLERHASTYITIGSTP